MAGHPEDSKINIFTGVYRHYLPAPAPGGAELDMGCGSGSFTIALAKKYPDRQILAADVMIGRLRKVVKKMERAGLNNMDVLRVEARFLIAQMLPDGALDRIHILCPDPWPKNRHRGHRLLCCDFTTQLHRVLKKGAVFHFSSDDENYCEAVNRVMENSGLFAPDMDALSDVSHIRSDFENRWLSEGKPVHHRAWRTLALPEVTIGH